MSWEGTDERISVRVAAAVRTAGQLAFGTLRWIDGDRLMVEADSEFPHGEPVEVRVELTPLPGTALLRGTLHNRLVTGVDEDQRFVVRVTEVAPEDEARFRAWIDQIQGKGGGDTSVWSASRPRREPQATPSEARVALERLDARARVAASPTSDGTRSGSLSTASGRSTLRAALRRVLDRRAGAGESARKLEPRYEVVSGLDGATVDVRWQTEEAFQRDLQDLLFHYSLVLGEQDGPLPDRDPIRIRLRHGPLDLCCDAKVVDRGPLGATFRLRLEGTQLTDLLRARRPDRSAAAPA